MLFVLETRKMSLAYSKDFFKMCNYKTLMSAKKKKQIVFVYNVRYK